MEYGMVLVKLEQDFSVCQCIGSRENLWKITGKSAWSQYVYPQNMSGSCSFCPHPSHFVLETATVTTYEVHRVSSACQRFPWLYSWEWNDNIFIIHMLCLLYVYIYIHMHCNYLSIYIYTYEYTIYIYAFHRHDSCHCNHQWIRSSCCTQNATWRWTSSSAPAPAWPWANQTMTKTMIDSIGLWW